MEEPDNKIFARLYALAYHKCFGHELSKPLSETESKFFENKINTDTGLVIGWRTLKNYSIHILNPEKNRDENPSLATMDTLARYVLSAPYTNEIDRKNDEAHHPYWFKFREENLKTPTSIQTTAVKSKIQLWVVSLFGLLALIAIGLIILKNHKSIINFNYNFARNSDKDLQQAGWMLLNKDNAYWQQRQKSTGQLTLYTLPGDNWPDNNQRQTIKNLLARELHAGCFSLELQMKNFVPVEEWQQAGILLLKDTTATSESLRISLGYNDLFGGNKRPPEIIIQGIILADANSKPEEFVHLPILTLDSSVNRKSIENDLSYSAIRIEKTGKKCRLLFSNGARLNGAFKEVATKDLPFEPGYAAIFALKGNNATSRIIPVKLMRFSLQELPCD